MAGARPQQVCEETNCWRKAMAPERRHEHTPDEERKIREAALDETLEASFPASDPPSSDPNPDDHEAVRSEKPKAPK